MCQICTVSVNSQCLECCGGISIVYSIVLLTSTLTTQVMCVLINTSNASGKSRDTLINCDELMRANADILVSVAVPLYCPLPSIAR